ncbi:hypothetical protein PR202_gb10460 [Eleusine coracana subsp. coracana]|uniref:C2H2-type domain-containing protein n=1 Tax=Eleusine coracana subsp. coracana TaxID=191504 RepID=A0AAV5EHN6_ELECO|nr:hypothetical protein QOZ80_3BG0255630 [Eleusine coracana subsp. coracana]GJN22858.1 hypothetical protein PR202_gb10460 [Eleusine coracana subsp. coracana]
MKHPREEEVSLALSLSTDSASASSSTSSTGEAAAAPSSKRRRRRGPVVATSGEGDFVCKTCNRAFPTFQALGGHRTSHLRGRGHGLDLGVVGAKALKQHKQADSAAAQDNNKPAAAAARQQRHECHICGLGFEMGQALGGHMRRHREEMAGGGGADDWVWRTQERVGVAAEPPVLLELFA